MQSGRPKKSPHSRQLWEDFPASRESRQAEACQAAQCLEWFKEFECEICDKAWEELKLNKGEVSEYARLAPLIDEFKNLLTRKINDGKYASREEQEEQEEKGKMDINDKPGETTKDFGAMSADEQLGVIEKEFFPEDIGEEAVNGEESEEVRDVAEADKEGEKPEGADSANEEHKEDEKESAETTAAADGAEEPAASLPLYTVTEFVTSNPLEVDPERLPESARLVHKRYMEVYEREIAPKLAELEELKRGRLGKEGGAEADKDAFLEDVRAEACRRLGVKELDGYDVNHMATVNLVSRELADAYAERAKIASLAEEVRSAPDFKRVDLWATEQLDKMPKANADVILKEIYSGDPVRIRAVYDAFAQKYKETQKDSLSQVKAAPVKTEAAPPPPKVISGSNGNAAEAPKWGYEDFASASAKEKADMLVGMGFVEEIG